MIAVWDTVPCRVEMVLYVKVEEPEASVCSHAY